MYCDPDDNLAWAATMTILAGLKTYIIVPIVLAVLIVLCCCLVCIYKCKAGRRLDQHGVFKDVDTKGTDIEEKRESLLEEMNHNNFQPRKPKASAPPARVNSQQEDTPL